MSSNTSSATTNENSSSNSSVSKQQQEATRMFHEKMKILNENFSRFVQSAYKRKPTADFTPTVKDYLKHVRDLDEMYAIPEQPQLKQQPAQTTTTVSATTTGVSTSSNTTTGVGSGQQTIKTNWLTVPTVLATQPVATEGPKATEISTITTTASIPIFNAASAASVTSTTPAFSSPLFGISTINTTSSKPATTTNTVSSATSRKRAAGTSIDEAFKQRDEDVQQPAKKFGNFQGSNIGGTATTKPSFASLFANTTTSSASEPAATTTIMSTTSGNALGAAHPPNFGFGSKNGTAKPSFVPPFANTTTSSLPVGSTIVTTANSTTGSNSAGPPSFGFGNTIGTTTAKPSIASLFASNTASSASQPAGTTTATFTTGSSTLGATIPANFGFGGTIGAAPTKPSIASPFATTTASTSPLGITTANSTTGNSSAGPPTFVFGSNIGAAPTKPIASLFASITSSSASEPAKTTPAISTGSSAAGPPSFVFGSTLGTATAKPLFASLFSNTTASSASGSTISNNGGEEGDEGDEKPEEFVPKDDNIKPLVPLPPKVDVKSGEEDEQVLFEARSRLYHYDTAAKENKKRGDGEMKILRNQKTGRFRCLMRIDGGIDKIIANFPLFLGLKMDKHNNKPELVRWPCRDFSENQAGIDEIFIAKFRDEKTAQLFTTKIAECVKSLEDEQKQK